MSDRAFSPIIPFLRYQNPGAAVDWLVNAFGFETYDLTIVDETIVHAELSFGSATVQLGGTTDDGPVIMLSPRDLPAISSGVYVCVGGPDDVDIHFKRAIAAGAEVVYEPRDTPYAARDYGVRDHEGHFWSFGSYLPKHND
jgi:uncharacterized glyoxalase superfamily protein PhnB